MKHTKCCSKNKIKFSNYYYIFSSRCFLFVRVWLKNSTAYILFRLFKALSTVYIFFYYRIKRILFQYFLVVVVVVIVASELFMVPSFKHKRNSYTHSFTETHRKKTSRIIHFWDDVDDEFFQERIILSQANHKKIFIIIQVRIKNKKITSISKKKTHKNLIKIEEIIFFHCLRIESWKKSKP